MGSGIVRGFYKGLDDIFARNDTQAAKNYIELELIIALRLTGTDNHAVTLINAGDVYIVTGDYEAALHYFLQAQQILTAIDMDGDYRMAALCNNISMVYRYQGKLAEAEEALNRAFDIIKGLPECRPEMATTLVNLGELQLKQQKYTMSEESFKNAIMIYEKELGGRDPHLPSAYSGLGHLYYVTGRLGESESAYVRAGARDDIVMNIFIMDI